MITLGPLVILNRADVFQSRALGRARDIADYLLQWGARLADMYRAAPDATHDRCLILALGLPAGRPHAWLAGRDSVTDAERQWIANAGRAVEPPRGFPGPILLGQHFWIGPDGSQLPDHVIDALAGRLIPPLVWPREFDRFGECSVEVLLDRLMSAPDGAT